MKTRVLSFLLALSLLSVLFITPKEVLAATSSVYEPYPEIEYGYSSSVYCGTIRYMSQSTSNYFYDEYWGSWKNQAGSECGTCSISMSLSYIGINKTAKDILDAGEGLTYFGSNWGGATAKHYHYSDISNAVDTYVNGNGKYSPPVIHLNNYSSNGHFVVLIGRISSDVYQVLDPAKTKLWEITINGSRATYIHPGSGKSITDTIDKAGTNRTDDIYLWYNPNASISNSKLTISFNSNGGSCNTSYKNISPGGKIGTLPIPERTGYDFAGWYVDGGYELDPVNSSTTFSESTTLYAYWANRQFSGNKLTFDANGGSLPCGDVIMTHALSGINRLRNNNELIVYNCDGAIVNTNKWGVEVAVDAAGKVIAKREYLDEEYLTVPEGGFVLSGKSCWDDVPGEWVRNIPIGSYVAYDPEAMQVYVYSDANSVVTKHNYATSENGPGPLPVPVKEGYDFAGWFVAGEYGLDPVTEDTKLSEDTTLCAQWANRLYTGNKISYELDGGTFANSEPLDSKPLSGINKIRNKNELIVYNCDGETVNTNKWGVEVAVDETGKVLAMREYLDEEPLTVPDGGFVLSGTSCWDDVPGEWVRNIPIGSYVAYDSDEMMVYVYDSQDAYLINHKYVASGEKYGKLPAPTNGSISFVEWQDSNGRSITEDSIYSGSTLYASWQCQHNYISEVMPPTCEDSGYTEERCSKCGDTYIHSIQSPIGHNYKSFVTRYPDCTSAGELCYQCINCGDPYLEPMEPLGHSWNAATCTTAKTCKTCGATEGKALGHSWNAATCTAAKTCKTCGATEGSALGHSWNAATCTAPKTCKTCGATEGKALGHSWNTATCTAPKTCKTCGATEGSALGHSWNAATCTAAKTCKTCGATEGKALGHSWNSATCTAAKTCKTCGATEGKALGHNWGSATCTAAKTCKTCGATEGSALGHSWNAATCTAAKTCKTCGATEGKALGHSWNSATCTAAKTCKTCGATEGKALGHSWNSATCTAAKTCKTCGITEGKALGHSWNAATCTVAKTCKTCGATEGKALGHSWNSATCTAAKTCKTCGVTEGKALGHSWNAATCTKEKTCKICGATEGKALGHSYTDVITVPTCTDQGYTTHTCKVCSHSFKDTYVSAKGHNYANGVCVSCGAKDEGYVDKFEISFANMTLGNSLAMNFAFEQGHRDDWTGCYAEIVKEYADGRPNKEITIPYTQWGSTGINGVAHYTLKFNGVAAKEMSDNVFVTIYDGNGNAISKVWEDSVRDYAMRTLNNPKTSLESTIMVVDLLNYGATAQNYFKYNIGDLANNQMTAAQKAMATKDAPAEDTRVKSTNYLGSNLGLESQILMRMAFGGTNTSMYAVIEFTNHSGNKVKVNVSGSEFGSTGAITIDELVLADGRKPVTVTVYNADGSVYAYATDSMESYIARMRKDKYDPLFEAILKFSDSAYNFFH